MLRKMKNWLFALIANHNTYAPMAGVDIQHSANELTGTPDEERYRKSSNRLPNMTYALKALSSEKRYEEPDAYLAQLVGEFDSATSYDTGNDVADALLAHYRRIAEAEHFP